MIKTLTKNGIELYFTFTEDCFPNEGGYFCVVYSDEALNKEIDNFVIVAADAKDLKKSCEEYTKSISEKLLLTK